MSKSDQNKNAGADQTGPQPTTPVSATMPEPKWEEGPPPEVKIGRTDDIRRLATAMAFAQGEIENAKKSSDNPHFRTSYAALDAVVDVIRMPLSRYQITRTQLPAFNESESWLDTYLIHGPSGQYISCRWPLPHGRNMKSQDFMAAVTYAKRGSIMAICGVAAEDEDDDGETGADHTNDAPDQQQGERQAPQPTKAHRAAEQWVPYAIRKIGTLKTVDDLTAWEETNKQSLIDLGKLIPEGHQQVMAAMQAASEKLAIEG